MTQWKYKITVFTPCYNSEKIITRVFDYLQKQTFQDFEWIIIDDVSKDNTVKVIESFIPEAKFPIHFIKNETNLMVNANQDLALKNAQGEFFIKLSHDDYIPKDGLKNFMDTWDSIPKEQRKDLLGITLNCCDIKGNLEGEEFPKSPWISNDFEMRFKYKIKGEKCSLQKTEKLKEYPFHHPNIDIYVPADLHFFTMNNKYKSVYANKIGVAHIVDEGHHVHLEAQIGRGQKYTKGISYWFEHMANDLHWEIWKYSKKHHIIYLINFIRYARYNGDSYKSIVQRIKYKKYLIPLAIIGGNLNELIKFRTLL